MDMTNPYAPPQAAVLDIADPAAGIVLADRGTRLGAAILDGLIFFLMVYLPIVVAAIVAGASQSAAARTGGEPPDTAGLAIGVIVALVGFVVWLAINIKYMRANGQSIGKKACGIKVVRSDGSRVSLSRLIWLRNVLNGVIGLIPLYGLIDALFIFGEARRCLHDYLADTIVIKA
jgi:uncharacterized RDD family membrane protein YckC